MTTEAPPTPAVHQMLRELQQLSEHLDRAHGELKRDMGMNATDLATLRLLIQREQRGLATRPGLIAEHLGITTATATALIDRLTRSGHVLRKPDPEDRRARVVVLTEQARREFFANFSHHLRAMRGAVHGFTAEQMRTVNRFLAQLNESLGGMSTPDHTTPDLATSDPTDRTTP